MTNDRVDRVDDAVRAIEDILDRGAFTPWAVKNILDQIRFDIDANFILYRARAEEKYDIPRTRGEGGKQ